MNCCNDTAMSKFYNARGLEFAAQHCKLMLRDSKLESDGPPPDPPQMCVTTLQFHICASQASQEEQMLPFVGIKRTFHRARQTLVPDLSSGLPSEYIIMGYDQITQRKSLATFAYPLHRTESRKDGPASILIEYTL